MRRWWQSRLRVACICREITASALRRSRTHRPCPCFSISTASRSGSGPSMAARDCRARRWPEAPPPRSNCRRCAMTPSLTSRRTPSNAKSMRLQLLAAACFYRKTQTVPGRQSPNAASDQSTEGGEVNRDEAGAPWYRDAATRSLILRRYLPWLAVLSLGWEIAQLPLYTLWNEAGPGYIAFAVAHCTIGDILIGTVALARSQGLMRGGSTEPCPRGHGDEATLGTALTHTTLRTALQ